MLDALFVILTDKPEAFAAFMSFFAAVASAFATWKAPHSAAALAEELRSKTERSSEARRLKLHVFVTLLQERETISSLESVRMLNVIDFVYADCPAVREAWAELFSLFNSKEVHPQLRDDKMRKLLKEMAFELGLSDSLKADDFGRIYFPNMLAKEEEIKLLRQDAQLKELYAKTGAVEGAVEFQKKFPPAPV